MLVHAKIATTNFRVETSAKPMTRDRLATYAHSRLFIVLICALFFGSCASSLNDQLFEAAYEGDHRRVVNLLDEGADVNYISIIEAEHTHYTPRSCVVTSLLLRSYLKGEQILRSLLKTVTDLLTLLPVWDI
jgi:hypothetical protein